MKSKMIQSLAVAVFGVVMAATSAHAISFNLDNDHCSGSCGPLGTVFGTVNLVQNGTTVDVTVALTSPPYVFAKTGAADDQAFKFNATGVAVGDITVNQTVSGQTLAASTGAYNGDGTGSFSFGIACTTCGGGLSSAFSNNIIFHVANATITDLTNPNGLGYTFVADIGNSQTGNTGPVAATGSTVPEPASLLMLGAGLAGLGIWRRKSA